MVDLDDVSVLDESPDPDFHVELQDTIAVAAITINNFFICLIKFMAKDNMKNLL